MELVEPLAEVLAEIGEQVEQGIAVGAAFRSVLAMICIRCADVRYRR
jgi:hypothetical protein